MDTKHQWLEKAYKESKRDIENLRVTIKKLEQVAIERDEPSIQYYNEIAYVNSLLDPLTTDIQHPFKIFVGLGTPMTFTELHKLIFPKMVKSFVAYIRGARALVDYVQSLTYKGPIFMTAVNEAYDFMRKTMLAIKSRITFYQTLLCENNWTVNLDESSQHTRTTVMEWLERAMKMLDDIDCAPPKL